MAQKVLIDVLGRVSDAVLLVSPDEYRVVFANRTVARWWRATEDALIGRPLEELFGEAWEAASMAERLASVARDCQQEATFQCTLPHANVAQRVEVRVFSLQAEQATLIGVVFNATPNAARWSAAIGEHRDSLTGLPDRGFLLERMSSLMHGDRLADREFAVLFVDLNGFKQINDRHGHLAGDEVLQAVAQRLEGSVREVDHLARYGGDEFVVLLERVTRDDEIRPVIERIRGALAEPIETAAGRFTLSVSIGVAIAAPQHHTPEDVLADADRQMYAAKRACP